MFKGMNWRVQELLELQLAAQAAQGTSRQVKFHPRIESLEGPYNLPRLFLKWLSWFRRKIRSKTMVVQYEPLNQRLEFHNFYIFGRVMVYILSIRFGV